MDGLQEHDAEQGKPVTEGRALCDSPCVRFLRESNPQKHNQHGGSQGEGEPFTGCRASAAEDERVLEIRFTAM